MRWGSWGRGQDGACGLLLLLVVVVQRPPVRARGMYHEGLGGTHSDECCV
jgi:hypothetical protein